jgi:hypothetical protein
MKSKYTVIADILFGIIAIFWILVLRTGSAKFISFGFSFLFVIISIIILVFELLVWVARASIKNDMKNEPVNTYFTDSSDKKVRYDYAERINRDSGDATNYLKCPMCGTETEDGHKFCINCGYKLKDIK